MTGLRYERLHPAEMRAAFERDHAALVETSWMLALEPGLVRFDRLSDDPKASHVGVYGRNPRFTASRELGEEQVAAAAGLLARRARDLLAGRRSDPFADLRAFVEHGWPAPPLLRGRGGASPALLLENPGRASRYLSGLHVDVDGARVDERELVLVNGAPGETGTPVRASELDAEHGFYLRRGQQATVSLGRVPLAAGPHRIRAELGLGGVTSLVVDEDVDFVS